VLVGVVLTALSATAPPRIRNWVSSAPGIGLPRVFHWY